MPTLVSVYDLVSDTSNAVRSLKARGFEDLTTYAPAPFPELEEAEDPTPSKVRVFTLIGGLLGVVTGFGIQIWMSMDWPIKIAGKNFAAIPPMWIIGFELTILFGGVLPSVIISFGGSTTTSAAVPAEAVEHEKQRRWFRCIVRIRHVEAKFPSIDC